MGLEHRFEIVNIMALSKSQLIVGKSLFSEVIGPFLQILWGDSVSTPPRGRSSNQWPLHADLNVSKSILYAVCLVHICYLY